MRSTNVSAVIEQNCALCAGSKAKAARCMANGCTIRQALEIVDVAQQMRAIRQHCLECMGGSRRLVKMCSSASCPLHPYRTKEGGTK